MRTWSTEGIPVDERVAAWSDLLSRHVVPLQAHSHEPETFDGTAAITPLGPATLLDLSGSTHRVLRDSAIAARDDSKVFVVAQLSGHGVARTNANSATVAPGYLGLVSSDWPDTVELPEGYHQLVVALPAKLVVPRLADPAGADGAVVAGTGCAGLTLTLLGHLAARGEELDKATARLAVDHVIDMLALTFGGAGRPSRHHLILQAALDETERRLSTPELSIDAIASHLNVSVRQLQQHFADRGTTFGRWVRERRIAHCRAAIEADPGRRYTIAEIARQWGFVDRSHFSRVFSDEVGLSPRDYRRAVDRA